MFEKMRKPGSGRNKLTVKNVTAVILFAAIIVVFALWGITPGKLSGGPGGVAAVVNGSSITLAEFQNRVQNAERNSEAMMNQLSSSQRQQQETRLRRQILEQMIAGEVLYQAAQREGVRAADGEVQSEILKMPYFKENGIFRLERYQEILSRMHSSPKAFERSLRKDIVSQKFEQLFIGSAAPSQEEIKLNQDLSRQKINLRFAAFSTEDLANPAFISQDQVKKYAADHMADIQKYYHENSVEFSIPERMHARHILIRVEGKRSDADAAKLAAKIRKQLTPKNFAALAKKFSEDPMSSKKGGDLGDFERGQMNSEFDASAFAMQPGQISQPLKKSYGYDIIYVVSRTPSRVQKLSEVQDQIARKLLVRTDHTQIVAKIRALVTKGDSKALEALFKKAGIIWQETGEFGLASAEMPKLGENQPVLMAVMKHGQRPGLVNDLVDSAGRYYVVNVLSWRESKQATPEIQGQENMLAYRSSAEVMDTWLRQAEAKASIARNDQVLQ